MYLALLLAGISLDLVFKLKIFSNLVTFPVGIALLLFGTFLILWAEHAGHTLDRENISKEAFCRGPYCYTRSPTHWGLFFLMLGFGVIINAFFVVLSTLVSFVIAKFVFQSREEKMLEKKYGIHYLEYKKLVKF
jgi:protein-S-isoprenylcysteine O-methyltransferase Ste14